MKWITKASPLFFLIMILTLSLTQLPLIPKAHAVQPALVKSVSGSGNLVVTNVQVNDFLGVFVIAQSVSGFNGWAISDSFGDTFNEYVPSHKCNQAGTLWSASFGCALYAVANQGGTDTITFACAPGGCSFSGNTFVDQYTNVISVSRPQQIECSSACGTSGTTTFTGANSETLNAGQVGYENMVLAFNSGSGTTSITANSGQTSVSGNDGADAAGNSFSFTSCTTNCPSLSFSSTGSVGGLVYNHQVLILSGNVPPTLSTVTQCYGNCGTPPITVVNTNSTHSINFNTSITLFYQFQANLNGVINNVTLNYAQICGSGNKCTVNTLFIAAYLIASCPANSQPFTSSCPASRVSQATFSPPTKARLSMQCPSTCVVTNGQWIGISVSATFSGIDINDTNTNVSLFQTTGINPNTITSSASASSLCAGCKMGLWAWITGNTVTGATPPNVGTNCGNGIGDFLTCNTLSFCTGTPNAGCQLAGGLFWALVYSGGGMILLMWGDRKLAGQGEEGERIIPGEVYFFIPIGVFLMFTALGVLPSWVAVLIFAVAAYLLADLILRRGRD